MKNLFIDVATNTNSSKWNNSISRISPLYSRNIDIRSEFQRDYTRIIHSTAYRRLKHKTQVFFSPGNDHICTRIEHVTHVESISYTIANYLGLNTELTKAISVAHDLGHSPFGHEGEHILSDFSNKDLGYPFWHEKNGLELVDYIELLEDDNKSKQNLNLTYAVRDGIISHCGEIDENCIKPRDEFIDLKDYKYPNQFSPYTWEACVVKVSDKIAYLGRDIEDAITLGILDEHLDELYSLLNYDSSNSKITNTFIINFLVSDLCRNSSPEKGLCFSNEAFSLINKIKQFNYKNIYLCNKIKPSTRFFKIVLSEIYNTLKSCFNDISALSSVQGLQKFYPKLYDDFSKFLYNYYNHVDREKFNLKNKVIFDDSSKQDFYRAILYYVSGMTDNYAIEIYNEIIGF
ncbi:MAG: HD domain-containing protein [Clostridia bacterium]|nr:HD domain-containing protein [Clostridia bacterium]